ncbi:terminase small subunit [Sphingobium sp. CAP-1]|uniref:terminase small subunit n=1 Tax=Sphingobium sp. CAP-1 TaxID=2676077 RepID=UPI0012BB2DDE|nr:terminase small subunit [Sphingobium sp. CAP-1]QGP80014.1 terminase small subunit [Sphingobium sp. CAP-1]
MSLSPKQQRFVEEYLVDLNATAAYRRAGYAAKGNAAEVNANRLLRNAKVAAAISAAMAARSERTEISQDMVIREWLAIAMADPNEVIQFRRTCCRHCHGEGHAYQWIDRDEFEKELAAAVALAGDGDDEAAAFAALPTDDGGFGFHRAKDPHPDCPKCFGEGRGDVFAHDTRRLSKAAGRLYAGVKITKDGFEIKLRDQDKALDSLARHMGMFKEKIEVEAGENLADLIAARRAKMLKARGEE